MNNVTEEMHPIQKMLEKNKYECCRYGGRNMFGRSCLGFISCSKFGNVIADSLQCLTDGTFPAADLVSIINAFRTMREDQLGMDTIYYFPDITYVDEKKS
jgi:hypothetical protein